MSSRVLHAWLFPILSLALGLVWLGCFLRFGYRFVPFFGLLLGPPDWDFFGNSFPWLGVPALLAGLLGFIHGKPKEIWSDVLRMWTPQAIFGTPGALGPGRIASFGLVVIVSSFVTT